MRLQDIHNAFASSTERNISKLMMCREIKDTEVWFHAVPAGETKHLEPVACGARIIFLCCGDVRAQSGNDERRLSDRTVYIGNTNAALDITAAADCNFIELIRQLDETEIVEIDSANLPYSLSYYDAQKYTEECKSPKTISRMLIPARIIPRFAMGSVETGGDDKVDKHTHPMLEQYFFGLSDNNCCLVVDDVKVPFGGNELVHIPLGSDHGIISEGSQKVNYIWMDFLFDEKSLEYMDDAHQMIDK